MQNETLEQRLQAAQEENRQLKLRIELDTLIASSGKWKEPSHVRKLLADDFTLDDNGSLKTRSGISTDERIRHFEIEHPYLKQESETSTANDANLLAGRYPLEQIFGARSSGKAANELARLNPKEYKRGRELARSQGLI